LIETGLFQIHAEALSRRHNESELPAQRNLDAMEVLCRIAREPNDSKSNSTIVSAPNDSPRVPAAEALEARTIKKPDAASVFLRLFNSNNSVIEGLGRYEVALWRQTVQTLLMIAALDRG
jgi:hypothetical protein